MMAPVPRPLNGVRKFCLRYFANMISVTSLPGEQLFVHKCWTRELIAPKLKAFFPSDGDLASTECLRFPASSRHGPTTQN